MKLVVSALENSANIHLREIIKNTDIQILGLYDEALGTPLIKSSEFNVMGFIDILFKIKKAKQSIKILSKLASEVGHILLIDSPAFNLPLAKEIKTKYPFVKITYYILPQVWAWKEGRIQKIKKYCDNLISILPFEQRYYQTSIFLGNPLLKEIKKYKTTISKNKHVVFMPGSRKSEIQRLLPIFKEIAKHIKEEKTLIIPSFFNQEQINEYYGNIDEFNLSFDTHEALYHASFAFICSGTATLEASLIGTPFVLVYKAKLIDYLIAKSLVKLKYIGLANIILNFNERKAISQEFIQNFNANNLIKAYENVDNESFLENSFWLREHLKNPTKKEIIDFIF